jgi:hypothetical protein
MLGLKGFERDFVGLVSAFVKRDVFVLSVMRLVSRTWRAGSGRQWEAVRAECILSPALNVSVFSRRPVMLWNALLHAFKHNSVLACSVTRVLLMDLTLGQYDIPSVLVLEGKTTSMRGSGIIFSISCTGYTYAVTIEFCEQSSLIGFSGFDCRKDGLFITLCQVHLSPLQFVKPYKKLYK